MRGHIVLLPLIGLLLLPILGVSAEIRSINGREVDIQPVLEWAAKKKGERPLKHWKLVQVLENEGQSAYAIVLAYIEGLKSKIALKNCPRDILEMVSQKQALEARLASARQEHEAAAEN